MSAPPIPKREPGWPEHAKQNSRSPLANAKRSLRWAEKAVERAKRQTDAAEMRLKRAKAHVEYLEKIEALAGDDGKSA